MVAWDITSYNRQTANESSRPSTEPANHPNPGIKSIQESNYGQYPSRGMQETRDRFIMNLAARFEYRTIGTGRIFYLLCKG